MTDRDRLIEIIDKAKEEYANDVTDHTETDYIVESLLNEGVIVQKYGEWKDNHNGTFTCSVCGGKSSRMNYCGICGAKLKELG